MDTKIAVVAGTALAAGGTVAVVALRDDQFRRAVWATVRDKPVVEALAQVRTEVMASWQRNRGPEASAALVARLVTRGSQA